MSIIEQAQIVAANMICRGGSFWAKIGEALQLADQENIRKLRETFPEAWVMFGGTTKN
jgi:hypothetical protein